MLPPIKVENASVPSVENFETNGVLQSDEHVVINAPGVVGKLEAPTVPVTYALPPPSTAIPAALSKPPLPIYVENKIVFHFGFSFVTNIFVVPLFPV